MSSQSIWEIGFRMGGYSYTRRNHLSLVHSWRTSSYSSFKERKVKWFNFTATTSYCTMHHGAAKFWLIEDEWRGILWQKFIYINGHYMLLYKRTNRTYMCLVKFLLIILTTNNQTMVRNNVEWWQDTDFSLLCCQVMSNWMYLYWIFGMDKRMIPFIWGQ